jgi:enoyl-CoA hydratase/carnithine racemase
MNAKPELLRVERADGVVVLTLNDPDVRNAISDEMMAQIIGACDAINADDEVRCVILTGAGKSFCAGGNVKQMGDQSSSFGPKTPAASRRHLQHSVQAMTRAIYDLEVPLIGAVNGHAMGVGCDLAVMCDIRIASESAVFSENFLQMGLVPADGGAWFLPRAIGPSRAFEMAYTCDRVSAAKALEIGLVSQVVADDALLVEARALAARIANKPPQTLRLVKRLLRESMRLPLPDSLELASTMQAIAQNTADHLEAVAAFREKREPRFTGA